MTIDHGVLLHMNQLSWNAFITCVKGEERIKKEDIKLKGAAGRLAGQGSVLVSLLSGP